MSQAAGWSPPEGLLPAAGPYSLGSLTPDGLIHTAGLIALSPEGEIIGPGDAAEQTREIFRQAREILGAAGATLRDVIFAHVFLSDMTHYAQMNSAYREMFAGTEHPLPPRYCIGVELVKPGLLVEIAFVARRSR